jgi:hypothetical protein
MRPLARVQLAGVQVAGSYGRDVRRLLLSCLLVLLLVPGWSGEERLPLFDRERAAEIRSERVPLNPADHAQRRVGSLVYRGGVALSSPDGAFGGFSAVAVRGDRFTLLSDGGGIARFRMDAAGRVSRPAFSDLRGGPGSGWMKLDRDSEALAISPDGAQAWVAFERYDRVYRYAGGLAGVEASATIPGSAGWSQNGGAEALVRLADGRFVAIREHAVLHGGRVAQAVLWDGDPAEAGTAAHPFGVRVPGGWSVSDAAELPGGDLGVLLRRLSWRDRGFGSALMRVPARELRAGHAARGRIMAQLRYPLTHDNFEGVAAACEGGRTVLWLVSDDNFSGWQRSLLLKFGLAAGEPEGCA